jgi:hypothetical protein
MRLHGSHRVLSRRHGPVTACVLPVAGDRARALSRWDAAQIVRDLGGDAAYGDRRALVELAEALAFCPGGAAGGAGAAACVSRLLEAIATACLVFVPGWGRGALGGADPDGEAARSFGRLLGRLTGGHAELAFEGQTYRLVHGPSLAAAGGSDGCEVVRVSEARALLGRMSVRFARTADQKAAWRDAVALVAGPRNVGGHAGGDGGGDGPAAGAILLLRRRSVRGTLVAPDGPALPPSALRAARAPARARFGLLLIDVLSGRPLPGVPLRIVCPDGSAHDLRTDGAGLVTIDDLDPGACQVESVVAGARIEDSFAPAPAPAPTPARHGAGGRPAASARKVPAAFLVDAGTHRIGRGDTCRSIARAWDVPWPAIATFNWGTTDPAALEERYRTTLGCARKAPDTGRYVFDSEDEPGIVMIPRPWRRTLPTGARHRIDVGPLRPLFLRLENEVGLALPGAEYHVRFADGSERRGRLGRRGIARLSGTPEGAFAVSYPDQLDLLAKSLAASARKALDEQIAGPVFHLLMQSDEVVRRAVSTYDAYFNDLGGDGLAADIDLVVTDPDARPPLLALARMAGAAIGPIGGPNGGPIGDPNGGAIAGARESVVHG